MRLALSEDKIKQLLCTIYRQHYAENQMYAKKKKKIVQAPQSTIVHESKNWQE